MRTLVNYIGLAGRLHLPVEEVVRDLADARNFQKQQQKNPEYFIDITDDFEQFFINWRAAGAANHIALERRLLDWDKEFSKLERQNETTNRILGELVPLFTQFISNQTILMATPDQFESALKKLGDDMTQKLAQIRSEIKGLRDVASGNAGKLDPKSFDHALDLVNDLDNAVTAFDPDAEEETAPATPASGDPAPAAEAPAEG